ncbi:copper homeostasis protein [Neorhizobium huautlense]|uniref:PF03932 family protein CutC n=1 Tax=Neorhizobium huautlense TaxID=67774 RepID=A0ABT9PV94_9HYPH|nr:copper homeostasis protein CutC [Neorhizobium huautlense]MDP9838391.1 copper homeostasis protein [Neorhizobium huautlense]
MTILLEVCVDDPTGLAAAVEGGADRIELCAALDIGGLTPSPGLMTLASRAPVPVYAMIRPRAGAFVFDDAEEVAMVADIEAALTAGLAGVVIGASQNDGSLDVAMLARLKAVTGNAGVTLHRAFDLVPDMELALEQAIDLGFERILTSGGQKTAIEGADMIARLNDRAGARIRIMPGSGLRPANVENMLQLGVGEVHASCRRPFGASHDDRATAFGFQPETRFETDIDLVRQMRTRLDGWPGDKK